MDPSDSDLVRRHQSAVRGFLRHLTGNFAAADDLAQDTFVTAYGTLARFRTEERFSTWLLGIARNHFLNDSRKRAVRQAAIPALALSAEAAQGAERSGGAAADRRMDLEAALKHLSPDERLAQIL